MKYLVLLGFLLSCSDEVDNRAKLLKNAEAYCACHQGLWVLENYPNLEIIGVKCNDGTYTTINHDAVVLNHCPKE